MAHEFCYSVSLSIVHPNIDPTSITEQIKGLRPRIEAIAGSVRRCKGGMPAIPSRKVALSHWLADLHVEQKLYSAQRPLSQFILEHLADLAQHQLLFARLREQGQVALIVRWFSETHHSAGVLPAELMKKCGDLGLDLELDYYAPQIQTENE